MGIIDDKRPIKIEMFYTLTCPNCRVLKRMLNEVLPQFGDKFEFRKSLANSPMGMIRTMKLGIHAVPTLLIDNKIVFKSVPTKEELVYKLGSY
ncbi:MAG: thioredoxin family protein [Bacteroidia bacterium]|nr:thioredoxin family protein [Bacteroidia bacterium]